MRERDIDGVVHLAAKKAVGESVERPLYYYRENVDGVLAVLAAMNEAGVNKIVYSSSAAAYGEPAVGEVAEDEPTVPTSPYGETKLIGEWMVRAKPNRNASRDRDWRTSACATSTLPVLGLTCWATPAWPT